MSTKQYQKQILKFMHSESYTPMEATALIEQIPIDYDLELFKIVLQKLQNKGEIIKTDNETYGLPEQTGFITGRLHIASKHIAYVISNTNETLQVHVPTNSLKGAQDNDIVIARLLKENPEEEFKKGEIVKLIKHVRKILVGTFFNCGEYAFVIPDDINIGRDIYVLKRNFKGAHHKEKVVVEIKDWTETKYNCVEGHIKELLGKPHRQNMPFLSLIKQSDLSIEFPQNVIEASEKIPTEITPADLLERKDFRERPIITIDGDDAQDLDDAVYVEKLSDDEYLLGVYIADVSYYVQPHTVLDQEACKRSTSVYLANIVLPMLPERLSNGICSLNSGSDRLVIACEMRIDKNGQIFSYEVFPAVINVRHRLTYQIVKEILENNKAKYKKAYADILPMLKYMQELRNLLHQKRLERGAIALDVPEQKVVFDEKGTPKEIIKCIHGVSESIIQEFMLAANETVANYINMLGTPCIYRVHETPALIQTHSTPVSYSLRQAIYQTENIGHFALATQAYTHFTSPIRRYPDLIVHRILRNCLQKHFLSETDKKTLKDTLDIIAEQASIKERTATAVERSYLELKIAECMEAFVGKEFTGVVSAINNYCMIIELPNGVKGLLHITSLLDDLYEYNSEECILVGSNSYKIYRIGDSIKIEVLQVNINERSIDFILAGTTEEKRKLIQSQLQDMREEILARREITIAKRKKVAAIIREKAIKPPKKSKRKQKKLRWFINHMKSKAK